jgi:aromatic amino acid aminotransferase I
MAPRYVSMLSSSILKTNVCLGINTQYLMRRDQFIKCLGESFEVTSSSQHATGMWEGCDVLVASEKIVGPLDEKRIFGRQQYFSFVPPAAGMFIWMKVDFKNHPATLRGEDPESLEMQLWVKLAEGGLLIAPGWFFAADTEENHDEARGEGHYRIAFSSASVSRPAMLFRSSNNIIHTGGGHEEGY